MHHLGERTRQALRASWEEALVLAGKYALWARLAGEAGLGASGRGWAMKRYRHSS